MDAGGPQGRVSHFTLTAQIICGGGVYLTAQQGLANGVKNQKSSAVTEWWLCDYLNTIVPSHQLHVSNPINLLFTSNLLQTVYGKILLSEQINTIIFKLF